MDDPFAAVFGAHRSSNPARERLRFVRAPGLTVTLRKARSEFSVYSGGLPQGAELTFRTQATDEAKALRSARRQLRRQHPDEHSFDWLSASVVREPAVLAQAPDERR